MLILREEQLTALRRARTDSFILEVAEHIRDRQPSIGARITEERLEDARMLVEKAKGHGIESESGIMTFVDLALHHGRDFDSVDRIPSVQPILASDSPEGQKLALVAARLRPPRRKRR